MTRKQWIEEIRRQALESFEIDPVAVSLTNWEAYADRYYDEGLTPVDALEQDIRENGM